MSEFEQVLGQLDNGGTFRATRYVVELRNPEGQLVETYDIGQLSGVRRDGRVVTLERGQQPPVTIVAATIDDAGRLTDRVHSALPVAPPPQPPPAMTADQRVQVESGRGSQSGCMIAILALVVAALLAAVIVLAFDQDWIDFNGDSPTALPGAEATSTPVPEEPTPTPEPEEPTPTPEPEVPTPTP